MTIKADAVVTLSDRVERLQAYDISTDAVRIAPRVLLDNYTVLNSDIEKPDRASVVGDGVLAFVSGMSEQNQADVQHSYLFASLVASKQFPRDDQGKEWYGKFLEVMQTCGWVIVRKYYDSVAASGKSFKMDQLVLSILGSAATAAAIPGPTSLLMLEVARNAISKLEARDRPLRLFEQNIKESGSGGFSVSACHETPQGEVLMAMGAVRFIQRTNQTQVLFVNWDSSSVDLYRGESHMAMVPTLINLTRATILGKLGVRAVTKIEEYEI